MEQLPIQSSQEQSGERRLPVIVLPDDPELVAKLEEKSEEYGRRVLEDVKPGTPIAFVLSREWHSNDMSSRYHKTDACLKWVILEHVLTRREVDTAELEESLKTHPEARSQFLSMQVDAPDMFDQLFENAALLIDQYVSGKRAIRMRAQ